MTSYWILKSGDDRSTNHGEHDRVHGDPLRVWVMATLRLSDSRPGREA